MLFVISIVLLLMFSIWVTASFRPAGKTAWLLTFYLAASAGLVLAGQTASLLQQMGSPTAYLLIQVVLTAAAGGVWMGLGRPALTAPFAELRSTGLWSLLRRQPLLGLLSLGAGLTYGLNAVLIWVVPPNNNDSLSTHLTRVIYWLQHGSIDRWPTSRVFQLFYPIAAQLQTYWTILFTGSDRWVGYVQWVAVLVTAVGIIGLARLLGYGRSGSLLGGLLYLGLPVVLLQSTTTQNDLIAAAIFIPAVYFLLSGVLKRRPQDLVLSGLYIGLCLGTKQTLYFFLPGFALIALIALLQHRPAFWRNAVLLAAGSAVGFVLFAAYLNLHNLREFGHPFGPKGTVDSAVGGSTPAEALNNLKFNIPRLLYQGVDTTGLPNPLDGFAHKAKAAAAGRFFDLIGLPIEGDHYTLNAHVFSLRDKNQAQEDYAWYGVVSWLIIVPLALLAAWQGLRRKNGLAAGFVLCALLFLVIDAWLRPGWDPFQGRYFAPAVALLAPFGAGLVRRGWPARLGLGLAVLLTLVSMVTMTLYNPAKPLAGKRARAVNIWTADRLTLQTLQGMFAREYIQMIERNVPADAVLGLYSPRYYWEYPLFGEHFTRRLVPVHPGARLQELDWMRAQGIQFVMVREDQTPLPELPPSGLTRIDAVEGWGLYRLEP